MCRKYFFNPVRLFVGIVCASLLASSPQFSRAQPTIIYDAFKDFSWTSNPTPDGIWSYGSTPSLGGPFTPYPNMTVMFGGLDVWWSFSQGVNVLKNVSGSDQIHDPSDPYIIFPTSDYLHFHPGPNGEFSVVRWTAPAQGTYAVTASFESLRTGSVPTTTDVHVLLNSTSLFDAQINGFISDGTKDFSQSITLDAGDTIEFAVGNGANQNYTYDSTGIKATILGEAGGEPPVADFIWDAFGDFSGTSNPTSDGIWSYGSTPSLGGPFAPYPNMTFMFGGLDVWWSFSQRINVLKNVSGSDQIHDPTDPYIVFPTSDYLHFHPGPNGEFSVIRWTAPAQGTYTVTASFESLRTGLAPTTTDVHVLQNSTSLFDAEINGFFSDGTKDFSQSLTLNAGDAINFAVGYGANQNYYYDSTGIKATISAEAGGEPPVADFVAGVTNGFEVQFTDQSTGDITDYLWDFGDGESSTEQNPTHAFALPGTFAVTLKATGPGGSDSVVKEVKLSPSGLPPTAYEYALMSKLAYAYDPDSGYHGERDAILNELGKLGWTPVHKASEDFNDKTDGYWAVALYNANTDHLVIAHRGTNFEGILGILGWGSFVDVISDLLIFSEARPPQLESAMAFSKEARMRPEVSENTVVSHTGHSLGATLAEITAACDGSLRAVTFDSPGSKKIIRQLEILDKEPFDNCDLNNLDANIYQGPPNAVNTAIEHVGEMRLTQPNWVQDKLGGSFIWETDYKSELLQIGTAWIRAGFPIFGSPEFNEFVLTQPVFSLINSYKSYTEDVHSLQTIIDLLHNGYRTDERPEIGEIVTEDQWPTGIVAGFVNYLIPEELCTSEFCRDLRIAIDGSSTVEEAIVRLAYEALIPKELQAKLDPILDIAGELVKSIAKRSRQSIEVLGPISSIADWSKVGFVCTVAIIEPSPLGEPVCVKTLAVAIVKEAGLSVAKAFLVRIEADPPDSNYLELATPVDAVPLSPAEPSGHGTASAALANNINEYGIILEAFLTSYERMQAAIIAKDRDYILLQTLAVREYLQLWYNNQVEFAHLLRAYADSYPDLTGDAAPEVLKLLDQWRTSGISPEHVDVLRGFGLTDDQIAAMSTALQDEAVGDLAQLYEWADLIDSDITPDLITAIAEIDTLIEALEEEIELSVPNNPPTADADGSYVVSEGGAIFLDGSATDPDGGPITFVWDLDNDGTFETEGENPLFSAVERDGPGSQTVVLQVCDMFDACDTDEAVIEIQNVAPTINAGEDAMIVSGETFTVEASFTDPGISDTHIATIDFGDGPVAAVVDQGEGSGIVTGSHQYFVPNTYTVEVCVTDDDGDTGCNSLELEVKPLSLMIDIKPGSDLNSLNLSSNGKVPVAILGSNVFDAAFVDPTTVTFAGAPVATKGKGRPMASLEDVNDDGYLDMVLHFETQALVLDESDIEAVLEGQTYSGIHFQGSDTIREVPPSGNSSNGTPGLLALPDGATSVVNTPTLMWSKVPPGKCYLIQIDDNEDFSSPEQEATVVRGEQYSADLLVEGTYYWRVQLGGACNMQPGPWSETWSFTINTP